MMQHQILYNDSATMILSELQLSQTEPRWFCCLGYLRTSSPELCYLLCFMKKLKEIEIIIKAIICGHGGSIQCELSQAAGCSGGAAICHC